MMKRILLLYILMISLFCIPSAVNAAHAEIEYTDTGYKAAYLIHGREVKITVFEDDTEVGFAAVCCYNDDGELIELYTSSDVDSKYEQTFTIDEDVYMIKTVAWNNTTDITPLMDSLVVYRHTDYQKPNGEGTEANPYQITTAKELEYIFIEQTSYYELKNDIDLTDVEWKPGTFRGVFDGCGHSITGIHISDDAEYSGFVARLEPQTIHLNEPPYGYYIFSYIRNLNVEIAHSGNNAHVSGGIAGESITGAYIEKCTSSGNITAFSMESDKIWDSVEAGGIVGICMGGIVSDSSSDASVAATGGVRYCYAGGIVGWANEYVNNQYTYIINCESSGIVKAYSQSEEFEKEDVAAGGIAGYNRCTINDCRTFAKLHSNGVAGGIAGYFDESGSWGSEIADCVDNSEIITE